MHVFKCWWWCGWARRALAFSFEVCVDEWKTSSMITLAIGCVWWCVCESGMVCIHNTIHDVVAGCSSSHCLFVAIILRVSDMSSCASRSYKWRWQDSSVHILSKSVGGVKCSINYCMFWAQLIACFDKGLLCVWKGSAIKVMYICTMFVFWLVHDGESVQCTRVGALWQYIVIKPVCISHFCVSQWLMIAHFSKLS